MVWTCWFVYMMFIPLRVRRSVVGKAESLPFRYRMSWLVFMTLFVGFVVKALTDGL